MPVVQDAFSVELSEQFGLVRPGITSSPDSVIAGGSRCVLTGGNLQRSLQLLRILGRPVQLEFAVLPVPIERRTESFHQMRESRSSRA